MPGGDRTGPLGLGPRTGRALGICSGYPFPGYMSNAPGFRRGLGRGFGRSFGRGYFGRGRGFWGRGLDNPYYRQSPYFMDIDPQQSKDNEKAYLEDTVKDLEEEIKHMRNRIQELSKEKKESP